jgi:hypothetical protein
MREFVSLQLQRRLPMAQEQHNKDQRKTFQEEEEDTNLLWSAPLGLTIFIQREKLTKLLMEINIG